MKKVLLASLFAAIACGAIPSFGQSPAPAAAAPSPGQGRARFQTLSPEERDALMAASQKARQDPEVLAAAAKMHDAMEAARSVMVAKDAEIAPVLAKIQAASSPSPGAERPKLTPAEMIEWRAARDAIKDSPEGKAWKQATEDYREALKKAMIATDPSVAPILDRLSNGGGGAGLPRPAASASVPGK